MRNNKLFICEKPSCAKNHEFLLEEGDLIIIACGTGSYKFDYQEMSFSDAPYTNESPQYKIHHDGDFTPLTLSAWNSEERFESDVLRKLVTLNKDKEKNHREIDSVTNNFLKDFDEIIFSCDSDVTGVRAFCFKLERFFNLGINWREKLALNKIKVTAINYSALDKKSLERYYENRDLLDKNQLFSLLESAYIKKDFFEYNYNLNSILFFTDALDLPEHLIGEYDFILTRNYILILFLIRDKKTLFTNNLNRTLENIGSVISHEISIDNLLKIGLIKEDRCNPFKRNFNEICYRYKITSIGEDFLNNLHKKVNDPHLGDRLHNDNFTPYSKTLNLPTDDFKIKYEKYFYNVFSKQKRFLRKINRNNDSNN